MYCAVFCYNKKLCLHYTLTGKRAWYLIEIMYHTNIIQNLQIIAAEGYHLQQPYNITTRKSTKISLHDYRFGYGC